MSKKQKARFRWYRAIMGGMTMSIVHICSAENVQVFPEPWKVLEPGKPPEIRSRVEIVADGAGGVIEPGDLVQIATKFWSVAENKFYSSGDWWLWIGFETSAETVFPSSNPAQRAALLGLEKGAVMKYLAHRDNPMDADKLYVNPLGDPKYYSWRKNVRDFGGIFTPYQSGYSLVEIKRVCKGQAKYRTVRLFDDSPVQRCTWAPISCEMTSTPREGWVDEAKIEAVCPDGKTATFQYGPVASRNGKEWSGPLGGSGAGSNFDSWVTAFWNKLPVGVQLK
jgi:hypothetical protein